MKWGGRSRSGKRMGEEMTGEGRGDGKMKESFAKLCAIRGPQVSATGPAPPWKKTGLRPACIDLHICGQKPERA